MDVSMVRNRSGARLAYVVVKLEGTVKREQYEIVRKKAGISRSGEPFYTHEMQKVLKSEPAGYMVYFPRGHVIRLRTEADLAEYNLSLTEVPMINMRGLNDPKSAVGRLLMAQDDDARKKAWINMEDQVIRLATAKTGNVLMPEQVGRGFRLPESEAQAAT